MKFTAIGNSVYKDGVFYERCLSCGPIISGERASMDSANEKARLLAEKLNNENKKYLNDEDFKLNDVDFLAKYKEVIESHGKIWDEEELINRAIWMETHVGFNDMDHLEYESETCIWCRLCDIIYNRWVAGGGLERLEEEEKNKLTKNNTENYPTTDENGNEIW